jgi:hypothetical protein
MLVDHPCRQWLVPLLAGFLLLVGCKGRRTVDVQGAVVRNGQPLSVSGNGVLLVTLIPAADAETSYTPRIAECERTSGKFEIRDVVPGKYRIGVEQFDPNPQSDKLNSAFRADTGKIVREIDGKAPLTIDLAKPSGG